MPGERLVQAMQRAAEKPSSMETDVLLGIVTSVSPLKVKLDKIELTESFLILGALAKETTIKIPVRDANNHTHVIPAWTTGEALSTEHPHTHAIPEQTTNAALPDILLWRGLKVGDSVYMLRCGFAQKYFILQRKEGID